MKEKATSVHLEEWLVLLSNTSSIPVVLGSVIRSKDLNDVFATRDEFFAFYARLPREIRPSFILYLDKNLLLRLFDGYSLLEFFKSYHTPNEALGLINFSSFHYDGRPEDLTRLVDWLTWFSQDQERLCSNIYNKIQATWQTCSVSAFLDAYQGDAVKLLQSCIKHVSLGSLLQNPGNISTVLRRFQSHSQATWLIYKNLFSGYHQNKQFRKQYPDEGMRNLISTLDLDQIFKELLGAIGPCSDWNEVLTQRLLGLSNRRLFSLIREKAYYLERAPQLLDRLYKEHPQPARLLAVMRETQYYYRDFLAKVTPPAPPSVQAPPDNASASASLTSLEDLQTAYLRCSSGARPAFLIGIQPAKFKELVDGATLEDWQKLFTGLHQAGDTLFIQHIFKAREVSFTPGQLGCFLNSYQGDTELLRELFYPFKFDNILSTHGGVAEFLDMFHGDFPVFLRRIQKPLDWINCNWGNVYRVHQRSKHDQNANKYLTGWILSHPSVLYELYHEDALYDVMSRLPIDPLLEFLERYQLVIKPENSGDSSNRAGSSSDPCRSYEGILPRLLLSSGRDPRLGRLVYNCYYPDLKDPFWQEESRWLSLFSFLETPEIMAGFMAGLIQDPVKRIAMFDLASQFKSFLTSNQPILQIYYDRHLMAKELLKYWDLCIYAMNREDSSRDFLFLVILTFFIPALMGVISASVYDVCRLRPMRNQIEASLPLGFPHLPPDKILEHANLFFSKCEELRKLPYQPSRFFTPADTGSSTPACLDEPRLTADY
jgi:hypothetical protein